MTDWRWECPSCDRTVPVMGLCETCGVFGVMRIATPKPHPGRPHEFTTTCHLCGERGFLNITVITHDEVVRVEPYLAASPTAQHPSTMSAEALDSGAIAEAASPTATGERETP